MTYAVTRQLVADLDATLRELHDRGWTRDRYCDRTTGAVCLAGACNLAVTADMDEWTTEARAAAMMFNADQSERATDVLSTIGEYLGRKGLPANAITWNDRWSTTKDDAEQLLADILADIERQATS